MFTDSGSSVISNAQGKELESLTVAWSAVEVILDHAFDKMQHVPRLVLLGTATQCMMLLLHPCVMVGEAQKATGEAQQSLTLVCWGETHVLRMIQAKIGKFVHLFSNHLMFALFAS